jgi:hypothetical protein
VDALMVNSGGVAISNTGVYKVEPGSGTALTLSAATTASGASTVVVSSGKVVIPGTTNTISLDKGNATLFEPGFDAATGIYWGRWAADFKLTNDKNAVSVTGVYSTLYSPHVTNAAELTALKTAASGSNANPQLVNATYSYVGGPSPSRSDGAIGSVNSMTVKANFSSQMITGYDLNLQFGAGAGAQVWDAHLNPAKASSASFANFTGPGPSVFGGGPGIDLAGTCTNCINGNVISGNARGLFTGNDARGLMTTYQLQNGANGSQVSGTGALKKQ